MTQFIAAPEMQVARNVLTDAEIKALPTTSIKLLDRAASGQMIVPIAATLVYRTPNNAGYTNFSANATFSMDLFDQLGDFEGVIPNAASLLGASTGRFARLFPYQAISTAASLGGFGATIAQGVFQLVNDVEIWVFLDNDASGDLTGGDAENTLTIDIVYYTPPAA